MAKGYLALAAGFAMLASGQQAAAQIITVTPNVNNGPPQTCTPAGQYAIPGNAPLGDWKIVVQLGTNVGGTFTPVNPNKPDWSGGVGGTNGAMIAWSVLNGPLPTNNTPGLLVRVTLQKKNLIGNFVDVTSTTAIVTANNGGSDPGPGGDG